MERDEQSVMKGKLEKIQDFLKWIREVLSNTYREPELERILRDLEKVSQDVGIGQSTAYQAAGVSNTDIVSRQMRLADAEIKSVE